MENSLEQLTRYLEALKKKQVESQASLDAAKGRIDAKKVTHASATVEPRIRLKTKAEREAEKAPKKEKEAVRISLPPKPTGGSFINLPNPGLTPPESQPAAPTQPTPESQPRTPETSGFETTDERKIRERNERLEKEKVIREAAQKTLEDNEIERAKLLSELAELEKEIREAEEVKKTGEEIFLDDFREKIASLEKKLAETWGILWWKKAKIREEILKTKHKLEIEEGTKSIVCIDRSRIPDEIKQYLYEELKRQKENLDMAEQRSQDFVAADSIKYIKALTEDPVRYFQDPIHNTPKTPKNILEELQKASLNPQS